LSLREDIDAHCRRHAPARERHALSARLQQALLTCAVVGALSCLESGAAAQVDRFALLIGSNRGDATEQELRYAEADAARMRDVLRELGDFLPENSVLLQGEDEGTVRRSLISLNSRIRERVSAGAQVLLLVYFSGHADTTSLHLGGTRFPLRELKDLVYGSAASFRIAVLDACRSGALTRQKGGKRVPAFDLHQESGLSGEGLAFLTASAEDEDAQESDELRGSFFTHALVSGLLGAADANGDGEVVLDEAYRYAYDATLRATSRTFAGTQHPTYRYDFHGRGDLVLTRPGARDPRRGHLQLPDGMATLLMRGDQRGAVVAEVGPYARKRVLSLRAGRYFARARGRDVIYEGPVEVVAGASSALLLSQLESIEYARLVRKGGAERTLAHGLELGPQLRSALPNAETPCAGGFVGYGVDTQSLGVRARLSLCSATSENAFVRTRLWAGSLSLRVYHAWDIGPLALELGLGPGLSLLAQSYQTRGEAEDRAALAPYLAVGAGAALQLGGRYYLGLDADAETHVLTLDDGNAGERRTAIGFAVRASLLAGTRF
jgi:hypothetical protein